MAGPTSANHVFLPWSRQGAASAIQTPDTLGAAQAGVVVMPVTLGINNANPVQQQVRLYGPGDVAGLDPLQIVRKEPRPFATDFEPNYFPSIEFDRPDFPWLFTPAKALDNGKLRPWLCLVTVRKQEGVTLRVAGSVSVLEIRLPAHPERELPDLADSWAWAHTQVSGSARDAGALKQALAGDPALTVSRLISPRRLDPLTDYLVCLVPAFDLGRKAAFGEPITLEDEKSLKPAWTLDPQPALTLPVYVSWEFHTGVGGDFESLVRLLEARKMPDEAGKLPIDIGQPGFPINPAPGPGTTLELQGALRVKIEPDEWPDDTQSPFQSGLEPILDAPAKALATGGIDRLLAPPIYGSWLAARHTINLPPAAQTWLDTLNLDPRHRATAALGTQVIQSEQEALMAAAWEQLGDIRRVNQMRRQAQLANSVNGVYHAKHFSRFSPETLLKVTAPAQARLVVESTGPGNASIRSLLLQTVAQSSLPDRTVSAPLRRFTSPRGVLSARFQTTAAPPGGIIGAMNARIMILPPGQRAGSVTMNQVSDQGAQELKQVVRFENAAQTLDSGPKLGRFKIGAEDDIGAVLSAVLPIITGASPVGLPDTPDAQAFRTAAKAHLQHLAALGTAIAFQIRPMDLGNTQLQVLHALNPANTITARVQASLAVTGDAPPQPDPLEPVMDAPNFPQPMYEALRDISQDFLFPGLDQVPANTVTVLETNPNFIEAFLVGLNVEMNRELLWRGYPTDQRGTFFRQFWEPVAGAGQGFDVDPINTWGSRALGQNAHGGEQMVLLVRGELLRRYPNSVIYAVAAVPHGGKLDLSTAAGDERHPLFRGTLDPDVTFLGFNLTKEDAIADPGWFFVIQEQPTEPRFGLDAPDFSQTLPLPALTSWNDLSWRYLANTPEQFNALSYVPANAPLPVIDNVQWGKNAAHQAFITLQRPVRIAIHAKDMIPK